MTEQEKDHRITELEAALSDRGEENAALLAQLEAAQQSGALPVEIPGTVALEGIETPDGKKKKVTLQFLPGLVYIGFGGGRVKSELLVKVANGQEVASDELAKYPALAKANQQTVINWFENMLQKNANIFKVLTLVLGLFFVFTTDLTAQKKTIGDGAFGWYPATPNEVDTLFTDSTITWTFPSEIQDLNAYEWHFQPYVDVLADTATITFTVQEALDPRNNNYTPTDTITITSMTAAAAPYRLMKRGDVTGSKWRIVATQSGSGASTQLRWVVRIRKKTIATLISE